MFDLRKKALAVLSSVTLTAGLLVPTANANEGGVEPATPYESQDLATIQNELSPELLQQAFEELESGGFVQTRNVDNTTTFKINQGILLTLPNPGRSSKPSDIQTVTPLVNGGRRPGGYWIEFTPFEQDAMISGGAAALGGAICLIPGVGNAACLVIGIIISVAAAYVADHGVCPGRLRLEFNYPARLQRGYCV